MTSSSITTWDRFADATLDHDQSRAAQMGRELAATPPVALAKRARHRKPNRRRHVIAKAAGILILAAAVFGSIATARTTTQAPAFYGITPGQASQVAVQLEAPGYQLDAYAVTASAEAHACHLTVLYSRHEVTRAKVLAAARKADPGLRSDITAYMSRPSSPRFWAVMSDCGYGL